MTLLSLNNNDTITGSTTAVSTIYGSLGNDVLKTGSAIGDKIYTGGGSDTITTGTGADTIYYGTNAANDVSTTVDKANPGYWGISATETAAVPTGSTSASMSTVTDFTAGTGAGADILNFKVGAWTVSGVSVGLVKGDAATIVTAGITTFQTVTVAGTAISNTTAVTLDGIGTYANASALATALNTTGSLAFGTAIAATTDAHLMVAYLTTGGVVRIADVDVINPAGATAANTAAAHLTAVYASDIVELTGVTALSQLATANIVFS